MKKLLLISLLLSSCSATDCIKESTAVYGVDVINKVKIIDNDCRLQGQEICPENSFSGCYEWHKKTSIAFNSNKIIIIGEAAQYWNCEYKRF